jgi:hypothetical protein
MSTTPSYAIHIDYDAETNYFIELLTARRNSGTVSQLIDIHHLIMKSEPYNFRDSYIQGRRMRQIKAKGIEAIIYLLLGAFLLWSH